MSADELVSLWKGKLDYYQFLSAAIAKGDDAWRTPSDQRDRKEFAYRLCRELLDIHDRLSGI
jgi:hypothetical protein